MVDNLSNYLLFLFSLLLRCMFRSVIHSKSAPKICGYLHGEKSLSGIVLQDVNYFFCLNKSVFLFPYKRLCLLTKLIHFHTFC